MGAPSQTVATALEMAPGNLLPLDAKPTLVDSTTVSFALSCKCAGESFLICAGEREDDSCLDPVKLACGNCGLEAEIFNSDKDGYDGRLGHGTSYPQHQHFVTMSCEECGSRAFKTVVTVLYNIDFFEDGEELEPADMDRVSDFFDYIDVVAKCVACGAEQEVGAWECG